MKMIVTIPVITGCGSKYTATNLANYTKLKHPDKNIALVDFDIKHPYLAGSLSIKETIHSIDNLIDRIDGGFLNDELFLQNMFYLKSGVALLKGTKMPYNTNLINKNHIEAIIAKLEKNYDYVFIAVSNEILAGTVYSLFNADEIVLVTKNNYSCYMEIDNTLNMINQYKSKKSEINLIINEYVEHSDINFTEYLTKYNIKNVYLIPYDESSFDNKDLEKKMILSMFSSKVNTKETFKPIIDEFID